MIGTSLVVQWLRLCAEGAGLIPDQGTKILYVTPPPKKKKRKKNHRSNAPTCDSSDGHLMTLEIRIPIYSVSSDCEYGQAILIP